MKMTPQSQGSRGTLSTLAEINVTPLVDVMLVLLIVFMISAPLMQQGMQIDLPKANAGSLNEAPDQVILMITRSKQLQINGNTIAEGSLKTRLEALVRVKPDLEVFIQGDKNVAYGFVAQVMAEVKKSGVHRVGLVTDPGDPNLKL